MRTADRVGLRARTGWELDGTGREESSAAREDGDDGGRLRVRTGLGMMKRSSSTLVSREYQDFGNSATSFHRDETFSFSLLPISCKNSFTTDVSPY